MFFALVSKFSHRRREIHFHWDFFFYLLMIYIFDQIIGLGAVQWFPWITGYKFLVSVVVNSGFNPLGVGSKGSALVSQGQNFHSISNFLPVMALSP